VVGSAVDGSGKGECEREMGDLGGFDRTFIGWEGNHRSWSAWGHCVYIKLVFVMA